MLVRPMLLHRMALVSVRLFCKNLGNLQEFFEQMVYCPPWQNIARTPMGKDSLQSTPTSKISPVLLLSSLSGSTNEE